MERKTSEEEEESNRADKNAGSGRGAKICMTTTPRKRIAPNSPKRRGEGGNAPAGARAAPDNDDGDRYDAGDIRYKEDGGSGKVRGERGATRTRMRSRKTFGFD